MVQALVPVPGPGLLRVLLFQELVALAYLGLEADLIQILALRGRAQEPVLERVALVQAVAWWVGGQGQPVQAQVAWEWVVWTWAVAEPLPPCASPSRWAHLRAWVG